jgi:MFS family permease
LGSSIANFAGPLIAGLTIDSFGHRAAFGALALLPLIPLAIQARCRSTLGSVDPKAHYDASSGLLELLSLRPLRRLFLVNAFVSIGWEVHTVFVPIYGSKIGMSGAQIGLILASFAAASFVVRFMIGWVVNRWSEHVILACAFAAAAAVYIIFPLTQTVWALVALSLVLGLCLGTGQPIVMSLLHARAPAGRLGEAAGIRITLIQTMGVGVPLIFGALGSSGGLLVVFWAAAACLGAGCMTARQRRE